MAKREPIVPPKQRRASTDPWKHVIVARRRAEAKMRQLNREVRTDAEQLGRLDVLLGVGVGATRERARLAARMEKAA